MCKGDQYEHMRVPGADRRAIQDVEFNVLVRHTPIAEHDKNLPLIWANSCADERGCSHNCFARAYDCKNLKIYQSHLRRPPCTATSLCEFAY